MDTNGAQGHGLNPCLTSGHTPYLFVRSSGYCEVQQPCTNGRLCVDENMAMKTDRKPRVFSHTCLKKTGQ